MKGRFVPMPPELRLIHVALSHNELPGEQVWWKSLNVRVDKKGRNT